MTTYFIAGAIERPGRVHNYVVKSFGKKALTDRGTIKPEYLDKALAKAKKNKERSLEDAILLAKRLKGFAKERKVRY